MHKEFRRTFRIPFELYQDIVEAAYDSGKIRDDKDGRKKKIRVLHLHLSRLRSWRH
jgi:hypothetical protein